jgi:branched-chain amino acid transport system ATP-binding protein
MSLLKLKNLTKSFGGLVAVNDVSFDIEEGGIVGLIGPNGAGKTTVFNLITGNHRPDSGEVIFNTTRITGMPTHRIVSLGIGRTFQTIRLFQNMTVLENVLAGRHARMTSGATSAMLRTPGQK